MNNPLALMAVFGCGFLSACGMIAAARLAGHWYREIGSEREPDRE